MKSKNEDKGKKREMEEERGKVFTLRRELNLERRGKRTERGKESRAASYYYY